jgi:uncharacterized membrane protein
MAKIYRPQISSLFILLSLTIITGVDAADNAKMKPSEVCKNNAEILKRDITQSEEVRDKKTFQVAKIIVKAPPEKVFKIFSDYDHAPQIFSYLKKSKLVSAEGNRKTICCEAELAGGIFKFEYMLEFDEHPPNLIEWHRVSGAFKSNEGYWKFEPVNKGQSSAVTYSKYVDAGFLFPQFLVKKELRNNMPVILCELKKAAEH